MNRTISKFIYAVVLIILIVGVGIVSGKFSVGDLFNRVSTVEQENEYGGYTYTKVSTDDKTVSWPESYEVNFMPTIDDCGAYYYQEDTDSEGYIIEYYMIYRTERDIEDVVEFYTDYYEDVESSIWDGYASIETTYEWYDFSIIVNEIDDNTEVIMSVVY